MKKKKQHGHYCKVCGEHKSNESFTGKGHASHICKACSSLSPAACSEAETLTKIDNMATRYLSDNEIKWLRNRMKDSRPAVKEAAQILRHARFPHYERNQEKKGLKAFSLDFYLHTVICDHYGDELYVHMRFIADQNGEIQVINYHEKRALQNTTYKTDMATVKSFLNFAVHELEVPFWGEDLNDIDLDNIVDLDNFDNIEGEDFIADNEHKEDAEPICTVAIDLNNGECREFKFYHQVHDEHESLYYAFQDLMEGSEVVVSSPLAHLTDNEVDILSRSLALYIFRMGVVEDIHAQKDKLSDDDMKRINKDVHNRLSGLITAIRDNRMEDVLRMINGYAKWAGDWDKSVPYMAEFDQKY